MTKPTFKWGLAGLPLNTWETTSPVSDWYDQQGPLRTGMALVDYVYNFEHALNYIAELEGKVHELEAIIDGRENDFGKEVAIETQARYNWSWPEKEE